MSLFPLTHPVDTPSPAAGPPYLSFRLDGQTSAALAMDSAQEVLTLSPQRITAIPNMIGGVLGLLSWRGRVFWAIDLPLLLGSAPLSGNTQILTAIVIRVRARTDAEAREQAQLGSEPLMAMAVPEIRGVIRLPPERIQSPLEHFSPELTPYLQGCVLERDEVLMVLDAMAIAHAAMFHPP